MRNFSIGIICLAVATISAFVFRRYSSPDFAGDAVFTDSGFWSFPRFTVKFPEMKSFSGHTYTYTVSGLPSAPMTLVLEVQSATPTSTFPEMTLGPDTTIMVTLKTKSGLIVHSVTAPLKEWTIGGTTTSIGLGHVGLRQWKCAPRETYVLEICFVHVDPPDAVETIIPVLSGGGMETP